MARVAVPMTLECSILTRAFVSLIGKIVSSVPSRILYPLPEGHPLQAKQKAPQNGSGISLKFSKLEINK